MSLETVARWIEPLAIAGTIAAWLIALGVIWRFRQSQPAGRFRRRRNWRLRQVYALTSLFYLALAASSLVLKDVWGWLYLLLAIKVGTWWLRRAPARRPVPARRR